MQKEQAKVDVSDVSESVLAAWRVADKRQQVEDYPCGAPEKADIEALLHVAFYASIQKEEGQFVTFSLMLLQSHKQTKPRHLLSEYNRLLPFSEPVPLSIETVRKLSGAVDERTSSLVVERREGQLVITGLAPFGGRLSLLSAESTGYPRPEALTVSGHAPGSLLISRANGNLGRFSAGAFAAAQPTPFHSGALGSDLIRRIAAHEASSRFPTSYKPWYFAALDHLLRSASGRGHGGSIIWVPKQHAAGALERTRLGHRIGGGKSAYDALLQLVECGRTLDGVRGAIMAERDQVPAQAAKQAVALGMRHPQLKMEATTLLDTLAQITCVDGATIIDEYFEPLAFGARLRADEWIGKLQWAERSPGSASKELSRGLFGTRHNSAIDFAGSFPGAIAFVLSQDGPVRAFLRRDDTVLGWPDCLNTMFVS